MFKFVGIFCILFSFVLSASDTDLVIDSAYKIKKSLVKFEEMDKKALSANSDDETYEIFISMKKFKKEYIDEEVKALSEIIGKIIKKTSYTKFEKSIKNINPEIKTLIYDITNDGFKYEKYVKTPYFNTTDNAMKMFGM